MTTGGAFGLHKLECFTTPVENIRGYNPGEYALVFVKYRPGSEAPFKVHERICRDEYSGPDRVSIKCPCKPKTEGGIANCFENTNCPCYKANIMLRKLNYVRNNQTVYNSFGI
ncbi:hypothetical protein B9Z55_007856 [Caenorhabditis nigoni]|uniref:Uncharacterized protein n=1 Tax=Caenorhabditis nigoni TaxID=1611254 RepID=A0A2G5VBW1_9PELO|nr:hypothetical protein B9Z55_007856 [Caenorhabditis nigoni]